MGEFATRKSDQTEIKIGTCEDMFYLRLEDRNKVSHIPGNVDPACDPNGLRFRLPFPDEDDRRPGEYGDYNRGVRLYKVSTCEWCKGEGLSSFEPDGKCRRCHGSGTDGHQDFTDPEKASDVGTIQLHHEKSGLLLNVTCHHGLELPNVGPGVTAFWNGKGHSFELSSLRVADNKVFPVVRCRHCDHAWRYSWEQVLPYIPQPLRGRLEQYAADTFSVAA